MTNKMLIDASHPEETRVVVQRGNRIEEFDFESASRKQLRGNIYLAKVTRVEPSLQAAFIEYGGNRHGFLAFAEIHPDYYQIPIADRQALLEEEARHAAREDDDEPGQRRSKPRPKPKRRRAAAKDSSPDETVVSDETAADAAASDDALGSDDDVADESDTAEEKGREQNGEVDERDIVEQVGGGDAFEEVSDRPFRPRRQYKIQEVIKRRQILLVQVVKEERGTKGAALTTYLSLAGRYSVLMPNTARGGGISRKITNTTDRKRLKSVASELEVPEGMGVILRTAGAARTKLEIKRDFEYLLRVWETVRELTLKSTAPSLVYEEGSLIKRAIRDLYSKDIEEISVAGEEGYREAKDFMKMLMPSQAKVIKPYRDPQPLFARSGVEAQLDAMFGNTVTLKSGGYIVINPTEALVSIDVNSGRSTREHNIEDTALKTNLEAAEEVARQLRLRDLAGLIVIDFIDMEEARNNRAVEKKLKDCLKNDRARIQVGRISHFGLMEMSRQRIRTGVLESSTSPCPHCGGTGFRRATPSVALHILRGIEEALLKQGSYNLTVKTRLEVALYILNQKRLHLRELERRFGVTVTVVVDDALIGTQYFVLERGEFVADAPAQAERIAAPVIEDEDLTETVEAGSEEEADDVEETGETEITRSAAGGDAENGDGQGKRRKRRRRRRGRDREGLTAREGGTPAGENQESSGATGEEEDAEDDEAGAPREAGGEDDNGGKRRRRRGRRGGRRNRREDGGGFFADMADEAGSGMPAAAGQPDDGDEFAEAVGSPSGEVTAVDLPPTDDATSAPQAKSKPRRSRRKPTAEETGEPVAADPIAAEVESTPAPARRSRSRRPTAAAEVVAADAVASEAVAPEVITAERDIASPSAPMASQDMARQDNVAPVPTRPAAVVVPEPEPEPEEIEDPNRPKRTGWWSRARKALGGQ